jgi:YVTN family beta-propeller protein
VSAVDGASGVAVDHRTGSGYVAGGGGVVVFDGTTCNARMSSGCATPPVNVSDVGGIGVVVDSSTGTLYVANAGNSTVTVVDTATCNAHVTTSCAEAHPAVPVGSSPSHVAIDQVDCTCRTTVPMVPARPSR